MRVACLLAVAGALSVTSLPAASAYPLYGYGYAYGAPRFYPRYPYGYHFGSYGYRRGLPNGTGYRGRGTFTGGPAGGYPSRN